MINTFKDKEAKKIYSGYKSMKIDQSIQNVAYRKLKMLNNAHEIKDLRMPPSNNLEKLQGNLLGRFSIRINDQYRIIFRWDTGDAYDVEIKDYH